MTPLIKRFISSVILIAMLAIALWKGSFLWFSFIGIFCFIACWEWGGFSLHPLSKKHRIFIGTCASLAPVGLLFVPIFTLSILPLYILLSLIFFPKEESGEVRFGALYIILAAFCLVWLRKQGFLVEIIVIFAFVALCDIVAFFTGKIVGGKKILPAISAGKTWSGTIAGWVCGALCGFFISEFIALSAWVGLSAGWVFALISQIGDFSISALKRRANIKDSGTIIPGHGGVLDRIDSHLAVLPIAWGTVLYIQ